MVWPKFLTKDEKCELVFSSFGIFMIIAFVSLVMCGFSCIGVGVAGMVFYWKYFKLLSAIEIGIILYYLITHNLFCSKGLIHDWEYVKSKSAKDYDLNYQGSTNDMFPAIPNKEYTIRICVKCGKIINEIGEIERRLQIKEDKIEKQKNITKARKDMAKKAVEEAGITL